MIRSARFGWLVLALLLSAPILRAQESLSRLQQQLTNYHKRNLSEKLFLHTDRSVYLAGETMWLRFFYVDGSQHRPLDVSRVAYLELLDKDGRAVTQTKVAMAAGRGAGSLALPASLASGSYVVRAYTHWMKETSPAYLFEKSITLINATRKLDLPVRRDSLAYAVQFFPEGGQLVQGLPGRVAFHLLDNLTGKGADCRGVLLTQANDTVARFTSLRFGIGTFTFTPTAGTTYRVLLTDRRGRSLIRPLPTVRPHGYTMQVESANPGQLSVVVHARDSAGMQPGSTVYLVAHTRQVVRAASRQRLQAGQATFIVDKAGLGEGISHLTVFDEAMRPVGERLYFKRPTANLTVQVRPDHEQYAPRTPVTLNLSVSGPAGTTAAADLSVSVYRLDSLQTGEPIGLPAYLWLTSDLHGAVEGPDYYLTHTDAEADVAADNLMLTHGWRRFRWETVQAAESISVSAAPEHRGPIVRARVVDNRTGAPAKDVTTYLSIPGRAVRLYSARSNEQGMLWFELDHLTGRHDMVLQTPAPDSLYQVQLLNPYAETAPVTPRPLFDLSTSLTDQLLARNLATQVQQRYYPAPAETVSTDSSAFYGKPDERYLLDAYTRFTVMEEVLSEYVPGVRVLRRNKQFALRVNNFPYLQLFEDAPLTLLDGVPVTDTDRLMAFSPLKIKSLDVITRRYFLGQNLLSGIVSFRTYKGDLAGFQLDPRAVVLEYDGLQARREFAAPRYDEAQQIKSRMPDFRNLLYWNPAVTTNMQGKASLTFYTSDQTGTYLIVTHGLTTEGNAGSSQQAITVNSVIK